MMKKLFISVPLFLVVLMVLVFVLAACNDKDISGKVKPAKENVDAITPALPTPDIATPAPTPSPTNVSFEYVGDEYGMALIDDMFLNIAMDTLPKTLESSGVETFLIEKSSVPLAGASRPAITMTGEISGIPIYESIVCIKKGNYMAVIWLTSIKENITEQLAGLFYSIE